MIGQEKELCAFKDYHGKTMKPDSFVLVSVRSYRSYKLHSELENATYDGICRESGIIRIKLSNGMILNTSQFAAKCIIWE